MQTPRVFINWSLHTCLEMSNCIICFLLYLPIDGEILVAVMYQCTGDIDSPNDITENSIPKVDWFVSKRDFAKSEF